MANSGQTLKDLLRARFELCGRISAANARKMSCQQMTFGAQIEALAERSTSLGSTGEAEMVARDDRLRAEISALEAEVDALERELSDLDGQITAARMA
ncbi:hypothetical protein [Methylorubrum populi]|uniref:hypothetical protein n=1 Tax=Methylorubrum populi TaxID=223967 RepID=UPI000DB3FE44|nr:hypothetical protein [Methylorubrum populi]PZP66026.1 MAG: hypothetical protein DI590_25450 [Methylorubrum populi]